MPDTKPPSPIRVGMRADDVLKLRGRSRAHSVAAPQWLEGGKSAVWHYQDCSVVLERDTVAGGPAGPYRVKEVVEGMSDGAEDRPENGT